MAATSKLSLRAVLKASKCPPHPKESRKIKSNLSLNANIRLTCNNKIQVYKSNEGNELKVIIITGITLLFSIPTFLDVSHYPSQTILHSLHQSTTILLQPSHALIYTHISHVSPGLCPALRRTPAGFPPPARAGPRPAAPCSRCRCPSGRPARASASGPGACPNVVRKREDKVTLQSIKEFR